MILNILRNEEHKLTPNIMMQEGDAEAETEAVWSLISMINLSTITS